MFLLFEVGIRHVPPDGMTVTYNYAYPVNNGTSIGMQTYISPQDQQNIYAYYAAFNRAPVRSLWWHHGCTMSLDPSSVEFTWHGLPVESWTNTGCEYTESAGGISDELVAQHLGPDISMPIPPPNAG